MLEDLEIVNGELSLEFDPLNTKYTVMVDSDVDYLEINYKIDDDSNISIMGNELAKEENEVVITVYNDTESMSYYFTVYKDLAAPASVGLDLKEEIIISENKDVPNYVAPLIASACFLFILLFFTLLFKKKKKSKYK